MGFVASVSQNPSAGQAGRIVEGFEFELFSKVATAAVPFGRGVVQVKGVTGVTDDTDETCQLPPNVPAADIDAIITGGANTTGVQVYVADGGSSLDLDGIHGVVRSIYGRPLVMTSTSHANFDAVICKAYGFGVDGAWLYDEILVTDAGAATDNATEGNPFAQVVKYVVPAMGGTSGTWDLGWQGATTAATVGLCGIALVDDAGESATQYGAGLRVNMLRKGRVWVVTETDVTRGMQAYCRHTSDGGSNTSLGTWRGDWSAGTAAAALGCKFMTTAAAGALVQLEVSL